MKFSIITPCFNAEKFLRSCLESVHLQSTVMSDFSVEHIVIDGGSTDETVPILDDWKSTLLRAPSKKFSFFYSSEADGGMSEAINKGARLASGDWWMWLNSDDYLLPNSLQTVASFWKNHPGADVVYGGWNFVDEEKGHIKTMKLFPFDPGMLIYYGCYVGSTACFFKKQTTIDRGLILNENFKVVMDGEYYIRLHKKGCRFLYCPEILAAFRFHNCNLSQKNLKGTSIEEVLCRQKQWAESAAIRRFYGRFNVGHSMLDPIPDAMAWFYYRFKKVFKKFWNGSY